MPNASIDDVIEEMEEGQVRRIPVVDESNKVLGIVSTADIALELDEPDDIAEVFEEIKKAIDEALMPALLILRNPSEELDDFTWHWMAVTGYDDVKGSVYVSTYAKEYELVFERVWVQYKPYQADIVILYPGENGDRH
jgi:hypothetical protein